jgi:TRAP-type mannitol/chloroaromatic compound transport system permease large subunit
MTLDDKSISLNDIYAGALPFAFAAFVVVLLIIAFPWLATGLIR